MSLDLESPTPAYRQIANDLRRHLVEERLKPRDLLPPVRQLAADLGVNLNTVAVAYRELQAEALITVKHGSGAVVASRTASHRSDDELRRPLRTALTQLVLEGMGQGQILNMVSDELRSLLRSGQYDQARERLVRALGIDRPLVRV